jgi:hypothetical protein
MALASMYLLGSLVMALDPSSGHDEGQLTFGFARGLAVDFLPVFFWQKSKPALALLYLPAASLGFGAYLVMHGFISALAVVLTGEVAQRMGHRRPWIAAAVLACSPLFAWCSLTGVSNSDGVALLVLSLYTFLVWGRPGWTGVILGVMPWVRYECAVFAAVVGLVALWTTRSWRLLLGACAWPGLYLGLGALYHRSGLWFLRYPPGVSTTAGIEAWEQEFASHSLTTLVTAFGLLSPALVMLVFLRPRSLSGVERAMALFVVFFLGLFAYTHTSPRAVGPAFVLGFSARYALIALPAVALLVGRGFEELTAREAPRWQDTASVAALVAGGWALLARGAGEIVLWGAPGAGALLGVLRLGRPAVAGLVLLVFVALGPLSLREGKEQPYDVRHPWLGRVEGWLAERRGGAPVTVYTNSHMLALFAERRGLPWLRVRYLLAVDMSYELTHLTNPENGQREAVRRAIPRAVFRDLVPPEELSPERLQDGIWFVLVEDSRTLRLLPPERWSPHLRKEAQIEGARIARFSR